MCSFDYKYTFKIIKRYYEVKILKYYLWNYEFNFLDRFNHDVVLILMCKSLIYLIHSENEPFSPLLYTISSTESL